MAGSDVTDSTLLDAREPKESRPAQDVHGRVELTSTSLAPTTGKGMLSRRTLAEPGLPSPAAKRARVDHPQHVRLEVSPSTSRPIPKSRPDTVESLVARFESLRGKPLAKLHPDTLDSLVALF